MYKPPALKIIYIYWVGFTTHTHTHAWVLRTLLQFNMVMGVEFVLEIKRSFTRIV